jgi:hypothetical protein
VIKLLLSKEKDAGLFSLLSHSSEKNLLSRHSFLYMDLYHDRMIEYTECLCDICKEV